MKLPVYNLNIIKDVLENKMTLKDVQTKYELRRSVALRETQKVLCDMIFYYRNYCSLSFEVFNIPLRYKNAYGFSDLKDYSKQIKEFIASYELLMGEDE